MHAKYFLTFFALLLLSTSCKKPTTTASPKAASSSSNVSNLPPPPAPKIESESTDLNGVPLQSIQITKTDPNNLIQYKFISGSCKTEGPEKIYSTYSDNVTLPVGSGACQIAFQECTSPTTCSVLTTTNFTQTEAPEESKELQSLLKQQFDYEQELQDLGQTVSQNIQKAAPSFDTCLADYKKEGKENELQALKDFAKITPQELTSLFKFDFSDQINAILDELNGDNETATETVVHETTKTITDTEQTQKTISDLQQFIALAAIPIYLFVALETAFEIFEIYKWRQFVKKERTFTIDGKKVELVRHSSGFLVHPKDKKMALQDLITSDKLYMDDPISKRVILESEGKPKKMTEFAKVVQREKITYDKGKWYNKQKGKKEVIQFKRDPAKNLELVIENPGKIQLDPSFYNNQDVNRDIYDNQKPIPAVDTKNKSKNKLAKSAYDPRSGSFINEKFGTAGRVAKVVIGSLAVAVGISRIVSTYQLADTDTVCADMRKSIQIVKDSMEKAKQIQSSLLEVKLKILALL